MDATEFLPIRVSTLRGDLKIPFSAYVKVAGKHICFCREGDSFEGDERVSRDEDFERSDRFRISPLLVYQHSEFTKMRLQYNLDDSDAGGEANTIWLGVEVILGAHPAHKF